MPGVKVRNLEAHDREALERFLAAHPDTTMFLRSNLRQAGIDDRGEPYQGTYAAAFAAGAVVGVAAHYWNGVLILEAPRGLDDVVRSAVASTSRPVVGLIGPHDQALRARRTLGLEEAPTRTDSRELLFAVDLEKLEVPELLADGRVSCRPPRQDELDLVLDWRVAYGVEVEGSRDDPRTRAASEEYVRRAQAEDRHFLLESEGAPVAYTAFNAELPDCVQVGGVYTPPELRSRGYARCAVAGSLLCAHERGVRRSVLFTGEDNRAARTAYRSLGYEPVGDYALVLFAQPRRP